MIKIINGVYGHFDGVRVSPKTSKDAPFSLDPSAEKRLVDCGVAEYVTSEKTLPPPDDGNGDNAEDISSLTYNELKAMAKDRGISAFGVTKEELVKQLSASVDEGNDEEESSDQTPSFDADELDAVVDEVP